MKEYRLLMEAARLKSVDADYRNHLQAFLNFVVKSEKKSGKNKTRPVYTRFEKFYNYENEIGRASKRFQKKSRFSGIGSLLKKGDSDV